MELEFWATTDVGRVRDHNEDNFLVDKRMNLFVVCDGMGGHAAGEVASAMSVKVVREVLSSHREVFERLHDDPDNLANRKSVLALVEHAIQEACARVFHAAQEDSSRRGMGTTCSMLLLAEGRGFIGHVGDSRIYLFRQDQVHQITEDHSLINEMIRLGKIAEGEEHNLPHKNAVTRAVGVNEFVEVDTFELDVFGGDSFLLCSDGLSGYFTEDDQIGDLLEQDDVKQITEDCIEFANAGGGKDNITAIVVRITDGGMTTRDIQRIMEVMRSTPYFQYLGYKELVQMVNLSRRDELAAGETLFAEGSDPGGMYLIVDGKVSLRRDNKPIATLMPGEHCGEMAIIDETPQSVSAVTQEESVVLMLPRDRFMELLRQEPGLAVKLLWNFLQTFTMRMRGIPYERFLQVGSSLDEPTPPSGTRVFDESPANDSGHQPSSVSGEFVAPNLAPSSPPDSTSDKGETAQSASAERRRQVPTKPSRPQSSSVETAQLGGSASGARSQPESKSRSRRTTPPRSSQQTGLGGASSSPSPAASSSSAQDGADTRHGRPDESSPVGEQPPTVRKQPAVNPNAQAQSFTGSGGTDPDATVDIGDQERLFDGMEWDDIVPGDLLEDEDEAMLRETMQLEGENPDETMEMNGLQGRSGSSPQPPQPSAQRGRSNSSAPSRSAKSSAPKEKADPENGLGKAVSGESVVKSSTPGAQVLKRTKLVVGERKGFEDSENTSEIPPLTEQKPDSTLELEIDDDNIEEIT